MDQTVTWPQGLREVARVIGGEAALMLARAYGGVPFFMPRLARESHPFAPLVGLEPLQALCDAYAGTWLTIPSGPTRELKKTAVRACLRDGMSLRQTALACGVTERYAVMCRRELLRGGEATSMKGPRQPLLPGLERLLAERKGQ